MGRVFGMNKILEKIDGFEIICPYCQSSYFPETEKKIDGEIVEECCECGKKYTLNKMVIVEYITKGDCELNCKKHKWFKYISRTGRYFGSSCEVCGKSKFRG